MAESARMRKLRSTYGSARDVAVMDLRVGDLIHTTSAVLEVKALLPDSVVDVAEEYRDGAILRRQVTHWHPGTVLRVARPTRED